MEIYYPKTFIKDVLIDEIGSMIQNHPYISFIVMSIGIEFLGKCINTKSTDWHRGQPKADFESAINEIPSLKTYIPFLDRKTFDLYSSFRCGLTHSVSPKSKITFSSKEELGHLVQHNGRLNLKVENFYQEFKEACEHVISIKFPNNDKMNVGFLEVPGNFSDIDVFTATGSPTTYTQLP